MPDNLIQPDANNKKHEQPITTEPHATEPGTTASAEIDRTSENNQEAQDDDKSEEEEYDDDDEYDDDEEEEREKIIWTPAFLLGFALLLVLGVSAESLFSVSWLSRFLFVNAWVILIHVLLITTVWLILGFVSRSRWIHIGCIFGGIWSAFMVFNVFINAQGMNPGSSIQSYINVATCVALLGAYTGLSIEGTLRTRWDSLLLYLSPLIGAIGVAITYFLTPQASILTVENAIAVAALIVSCALWWLRPSCWKTQPGPTFLFGMVPAIILAMAAYNTSMHNLFLLQTTYAREFGTVANSNNFFFAQLILLCLLLGCIRITKGEQQMN
jgi:hypothetical protein